MCAINDVKLWYHVPSMSHCPAIFIDVLSKTMTALSQYSWIRDQHDSRAPALLLSHLVPFAIITAIIITTNIHALCHLV